MASFDAARIEDDHARTAPRRALLVACLAHLLHDGYTDLLYVLLPIWQKEFGLGYAALAAMRALYYGVMAAGQVPVTRWLGFLGPSLLLVTGTLLAALGFVGAGLSTGLVGLCVALAFGGLGSSTQHPYASALVTHGYGDQARGPLGLYNFAGDLGKAIFPAATALLLLAMNWRTAAYVIAGVGLVVAIFIQLALPRDAATEPATPAREARQKIRPGFALLFTLGMLDTACRMGYLLFLPFIVTGRGAQDATIGVALALVFIGGAFGKAVCGWLGERLGLFRTVALTETATVALIAATMVLPLWAILAVLPLLGIMLNGTSSVLYGTVPDFSPPGQTARMFAIFYTGVIGSGAVAPIAYGAFADAVGRSFGVAAAALTALACVPLAALLARALSR